MASSSAIEKTEEQLRKEIAELHRIQREISDRLRNPRGIRNSAVRGNRQRNFRVPDRVHADGFPLPKRRLSSAVVKIEEGEIIDDVQVTKVPQNEKSMENTTDSHRMIVRVFEAPETANLPRILLKGQDPALINRNKRMFGQILGTLEKFKVEDVQFTGTDAYIRRSSSLHRAEERAREESERLWMQEREQIAEKRRRDLALRARVSAKAEEKKLELLFLRWSEHQKNLCRFMRTKAGPHVYYCFNRSMDEGGEFVSGKVVEERFLRWKMMRREEVSEYQRKLADEYMNNVEGSGRRWGKGLNSLDKQEESMENDLEKHMVENGGKWEKDEGNEEYVDDINEGEDDIMGDDLLIVDVGDGKDIL